MPKEHCQPIRDDIAEVEKTINELEEFLPEAPSSMRPTITERIKREKVHLTQLKRALRLCERNH